MLIARVPLARVSPMVMLIARVTLGLGFRARLKARLRSRLLARRH
jgi:hypothetical protein